MRSIIICLFLTLYNTQAAFSNQKQDQAAYDGWYKMNYHRGFTSLIDKKCPHLSLEGIIQIGSSLRVDSWSSDDKRYDIQFKYGDKGLAKGISDAKKYIEKYGKTIYCTKLFKQYGPDGTIEKNDIIYVKKLNKTELIVRFANFSNIMTLNEVKKNTDKMYCSKTRGETVKTCHYYKKTEKYKISFDKIPSGKTVRMEYSVPLPEHMKNHEALKQAYPKFKRFSPILKNEWLIKKGVKVRIYVYEDTSYVYGHKVVNGRELTLVWEDLNLKKVNEARYRAEDNNKKKLKEKKRSEKAKLTKLPL